MNITVEVFRTTEQQNIIWTKFYKKNRLDDIFHKIGVVLRVLEATLYKYMNIDRRSWALRLLVISPWSGPQRTTMRMILISEDSARLQKKTVSISCNDVQLYSIHINFTIAIIEGLRGKTVSTHIFVQIVLPSKATKYKLSVNKTIIVFCSLTGCLISIVFSLR